MGTEESAAGTRKRFCSFAVLPSVLGRGDSRLPDEDPIGDRRLKGVRPGRPHGRRAGKWHGFGTARCARPLYGTETALPRYRERQRSNILRDRERVAALALLEEKLRQIEVLGGKVAGSHYREGKPEEDVARLAEELEVSLIVAGGWEVRFAFRPELFGDCLPSRGWAGGGRARSGRLRGAGRGCARPTSTATCWG
jgi:nucleotide-binding universal stress UspA family protein